MARRVRSRLLTPVLSTRSVRQWTGTAHGASPKVKSGATVIVTVSSVTLDALSNLLMNAYAILFAAC